MNRKGPDGRAETGIFGSWPKPAVSRRTEAWERDGHAPTWQGPEHAGEARTSAYFIGLVVLALGAQAIITWFTGNLLALIDLATVLSFLTGPLFGALNLWVLLADEVPEALRPKGALFGWHVVGFVFNGLLVLGLAWSKLA